MHEFHNPIIVGYIGGAPIEMRTIKHDPHSGQFMAGAGSSPSSVAHAASAKAHHDNTKESHEIAQKAHEAASLHLKKQGDTLNKAYIHQTNANLHKHLANAKATEGKVALTHLAQAATQHAILHDTPEAHKAAKTAHEAAGNKGLADYHNKAIKAKPNNGDWNPH